MHFIGCAVPDIRARARPTKPRTLVTELTECNTIFCEALAQLLAHLTEVIVSIFTIAIYVFCVRDINGRALSRNRAQFLVSKKPTNRKPIKCASSLHQNHRP